MEKERLITKTEEIWMTEAGIVYCKVKHGYLDLEGAEAYVNAIRQIGKGEKQYVIIDLRMGRGASQAARNYLAQEGAAVHAAIAFWIASAFTKMLGNFFIGFSKPNYPTQLFTEEAKALDWLKAQQLHANTGNGPSA